MFLMRLKFVKSQQCAIVRTLSQMEIYPASKETLVKPGILTKTFLVRIQNVAKTLTSLVQIEKDWRFLKM